MKNIISRIKQKKELSGIDDSVIEDALNNYAKKAHISLSNLRPSEQKILVKLVRAELRKYSGRFQASFKKRKELLEQNRINELLETHSSTKERIEFYPEIVSLISRLNAESILDLGAGLNPIAIAKPGMKYYALDINADDLYTVREYFVRNNISGEIIIHDLRKPFNFPKADLCLILKVFDVIETSGHKLAERIISSLNCKHILISFSTKTLSNAPMRHPQRGWIERLLERLGYSFRIIKSKNEIFYLAEKN
jgi:hypothetical protein